MRYLLISFLISFACLQVKAGGVVESTGTERKKVYVLSIGFSADTTRQSRFSIFSKCAACLTDARGVSDYFQHLQIGKGFDGLTQKVKRSNNFLVDEVHTYTYTTDITLDTLYNAFNRLQAIIKPGDVFVFYYASMAWGIQKDELGNQEGYYAFNSAAYNNKSNREGYVFTLRHLKTLTDRIAAQQQLIIFDTGDGRVIMPDYYRNFFNDNIEEAMFSKKNRVVICPEKFSGESTDTASKTIKGDMFKVISNLPAQYNILSLLDTTDKASYKTFMKYWYELQAGVMANIKIIQETDYLKMLQAIRPSQGDGKRGLTIHQKPAEIDSNILNRKKKVLIVATSEYDGAKTWDPLKNPLNDGSDAVKVFTALGYEVTPLFNAPKNVILSAISDLVDNEIENPYSQYVIYFAGHGYYDQRQKAGYIVCKDSRDLKDNARPTMSELDTYIDYTVLFRKLDALNKVILVTDVCFGGTSLTSLLQKNVESDPRGEKYKQKNPFKKVLASGITEVNDFIRLHNGSITRNSPFAAALLNILQKEGNTLSFEDLYAKLRSIKGLSPTPIESSFGTERIPNSFTF